MDKGLDGRMMEEYILGDSRMAIELKGRSISCKKMAIIHYFMSSISLIKRFWMSK
jgi:hypothetical protein